MENTVHSSKGNHLQLSFVLDIAESLPQHQIPTIFSFVFMFYCSNSTDPSYPMHPSRDSMQLLSYGKVVSCYSLSLKLHIP